MPTATSLLKLKLKRWHDDDQQQSPIIYQEGDVLHSFSYPSIDIFGLHPHRSHHLHILNCTCRAAALLRPHLALLEHGDLLLQRDVLLLQLGVVLQQTSLPELVLLGVIPKLIPLELHHLAVLWGQTR